MTTLIQHIKGMVHFFSEEKEEWRIFKIKKGGQYWVSNKGRVRRHSYCYYRVAKKGTINAVYYRNKRNLYIKYDSLSDFFMNGKEVKDIKGFYSDGFYFVGAGMKKYRVHRLVAKYFLGGEEKRFVLHNNGDKTNNKVGNLQWSDSTNRKGIKTHDRIRKVLCIKGRKKTEYSSANNAALILKIDPATIHKVLKGFRKQCYGYQFKYI